LAHEPLEAATGWEVAGAVAGAVPTVLEVEVLAGDMEQAARVITSRVLMNMSCRWREFINFIL
jgi:hypothetical protein